ncbi:class I SAM-dependent methyltransferase [Actinomadura roseirufa]|uniref:class I SAM-dependent methyltransferase n=1 Tax=Actinomadura roseirufa TaxID=2094049 RepID=UPI0010414E7B|nr:class I SAM-dependent methyltransferase [Actinomadura roseirufa]
MTDNENPPAGGASEDDTVNSGLAWEDYWHRVARGDLGAPPWNVERGTTTAPYLPIMLRHMTAGLPLVDMGCGDGGITRHLARFFERVVGLDVSPSAIARARERTSEPNVEFDVLDLSDEIGARRITDRLGDVDLHLRGVLHAIPAHARTSALAVLARLAGGRGRVFDTEVRHPGQATRVQILRTLYGRVPDRVADVDRAGLRVQKIDDLAALYRDAGWRVIETGDQTYHSDVRLPDGGFVQYPFQYVLARPDNDAD